MRSPFRVHSGLQQVRRLTASPPTFRSMTTDVVSQYSQRMAMLPFGGPAAVSLTRGRPVALRPPVSRGLPFRVPGVSARGSGDLSGLSSSRIPSPGLPRWDPGSGSMAIAPGAGNVTDNATADVGAADIVITGGVVI